MGSETLHQMGWYWVVLATEYELLRRNGQYEEARRTLEELKIHIDVFGDPLDFEILEITETRLVLSLLLPDDPTVKLPYEKIVFRR